MSEPVSQRSYNPLLELVLARVREFYRQPEAIFWVYGFPLLMVVGLGIAFRERPAEQITVDVQQGAGAQQLVDVLDDNENISVKLYPEEDCRRRLRTGKTDLVVILEDSSKSGYAFHFDPDKPGSLLARNTVDDLVQRAGGRADPVDTRDVEMDEPGGRYVDFLIPGLLGMSLMGGGLWGVGFVTVDMRIRNLLKRFTATPMKKTHFLGSIMISRMLFMIPEVLLMLLFARYAFGVVIYGNLLLLVGLIVLGSVVFSGIGLLLACRARTLESISGLMNLVMLPMWILSGIFFSTERFPDAVQPVIAALPLTQVNNALRSVMLEGAPLSSLGLEISLMVIWSVASFALALKWFRWS